MSGEARDLKRLGTSNASGLETPRDLEKSPVLEKPRAPPPEASITLDRDERGTYRPHHPSPLAPFACALTRTP